MRVSLNRETDDFFFLLMLLPLFVGVGVLGPCFVMQYTVSFLVLQQSCRGRERLLIYFTCLLDVLHQLRPFQV